VKATGIAIEVVYALGDRQWTAAVRLPAGSTLQAALLASGVFEAHPQLQGADLALGIWGRRASPDALLRQGDRVEIYRPLIADPKSARRTRAAKRAAG
jgi:hypothetical protein